MGRYSAMDRDHRWERTQSAYDLLVHGRAAHHVEDAPTAAREAYVITDAFLAAFDSDRPAFSVTNFANADMVGHTGVIPATIAGVEAMS